MTPKDRKRLQTLHARCDRLDRLALGFLMTWVAMGKQLRKQFGEEAAENDIAREDQYSRFGDAEMALKQTRNELHAIKRRN